MTNKRISLEIKNEAAYVGFGFNSTRSMTTLDVETMTELLAIIKEISDKAKELKGVIFFSHVPNCFLAGADINLISSMTTEADAADASNDGGNSDGSADSGGSDGGGSDGGGGDGGGGD